MNINLKSIVQIGVIAAIYVIVTIILAPFSYGPVQVRVSEALTLLPFFLGSHIAIALWIGCMIANIFGGFGIIDIIFGSLITLIAGLLTARAGNIIKAGLYPVLLNAFGIALILYFVAGFPYLSTVFYIAIGQSISVYAIGIPLARVIYKRLDNLKL
jgi:uncharacterized membrane protein